MNYKVTHSTRYSYTSPVRVCHNLVLLTPREDSNVICHTHRLQIRPTPSISTRRYDFFGNLVHAFSIEESHRQLTVTATSRVTVQPPASIAVEAATPWESVVQQWQRQEDPHWLTASPFMFDSNRIVRHRDFADYARASFTAKRPIAEAVLDLAQRIHQDFEYDAQATDVNTPTREAFQKRRGVCQDFAHVGIACLRSLGLAARYVSGYLRTLPPPGQPRLIGADQSHAWLAVYVGSGAWLSVDPTNACVCSTDHVPIAWGRDYHDVVPIRGVFLGGGEHALEVSVDVAEEGASSSQSETGAANAG